MGKLLNSVNKWFNVSNTSSAYDTNSSLDDFPDSNIPDVEERGRISTDVYGMPEYQELNSDFWFPQSCDRYTKMVSDPIPAAIFSIIALPILQAERIILPGDSTPLAKDAAIKLEANLKNLLWRGPSGRWQQQNFTDVLRNALKCLVYGFSCDEMVFRMDGTRVALAKLSPRMPKSINRFLMHPDNTSDFLGIEQYITTGYKAGFVKIPADKLTMYIHDREGESLIGRSLFRSMYGPWYYKTNLQKAQAIGIERTIMGVPQFVTLDATNKLSDDEKAAATRIVTNIKVGEKVGVVCPPGWELKFAVTQPHVIVEVLQYFDRQMAAAAVQQIVTAGSDGSGSYAQAQTQDVISIRFVAGIAKNIADSINSGWLRKWHFYNYGYSCPSPTFNFGPIYVPSPKEIAVILGQLVNAGMLRWHESDENWTRAKVGMPIPNPNEPILELSPSGQNQGPATNQPQAVPPQDSKEALQASEMILSGNIPIPAPLQEYVVGIP